VSLAEDRFTALQHSIQETEMTKTRLAYSKKEAATATSISVRSIDYLISKGKLRAVKIGRRVVIPARDLEKLIYNGSGVGPLRESSSVASAVEAGVS
jgi:excisionase family DNA binding protein